MNYEELLKRAMEKLPKRIENKERFQMPEAIIEISGPKAIIKNFGEIISVLRRDGKHLAKYLGRELATADVIQGSTLVFQGRVSREILQRKINDYVKEFVYCKECGEPDTRLVKEDRITFIKCEACGAKHPARSI